MSTIYGNMVGGAFPVKTDPTLTKEGKPADAKVVGDKIAKLKEEIESKAQMNFDWRFRPDNSLCRILIEKSVALTDRTQWNAQFDWIIDVMLRMKETFTPYL